MIEVYLRAALGEWGWQLLQVLLDHRLLISSAIIGVYLAYRIFRWAGRGPNVPSVRR